MQTAACIHFRLLINYMVKRGPEFSLFRRTVNRIQSLFRTVSAQRIQIVDPLLRGRGGLSPRNSTFPQFIPSNEPLVLIIDEIDHYERYHPGYDEYVVEADEIWHDPYVLIAIISAYYDGEEWNIDSAMPVINKYFDLQYEVTETVRTRTWTDDNGVLQSKSTCTVKLINKNLSHLPVVSMSHHTLGMYALYMGTHGNMEGIFRGGHASALKDPMLYDIPQETLDANPTFARLMEEANKYIGYPYVWGGSDPETSFDCSGFISYVFTNSGVYNTGRLGAKGLRSLCRNVPVDQVKLGDIVFFDGTIEGAAGVTHCGIYVGNNMMLHCGSPIGYANLNDSYWRQHFHSFGRVPY